LKHKYEGNKDLSSISFLKDFKKVMDIINSSPITTRKNKLTSILVALKTDDKYKDLHKKYNKELLDLNKEYLEFLKLQQKTPNQKKNWIEYDKLIDISNEIQNKVKKKKLFNESLEDLNRLDFKLLQNFILLKTYIDFPLRNDFNDMKVLTKEEYDSEKKEVREKNNYLITLPRNKKVFIFNQFKNHNVIGTKKLKVPKHLNTLYNKWLKINKSGYLFVKNNKPYIPMKPVDITRSLQSIFSKYANGKRISTQMLRHIIVSNDLKNQKSLVQMEKDTENKYFHSAGMNQLYRKL
jgi:hypothetical protein